MNVEGGIVYLLMVLNVNAYAKLFLNVARVYRPDGNKTKLNTNG